MAPPKSKLYPKTGKLKTINSSSSPVIPSAAAASATTQASVATDTEAERQLELELCWCIQTLEASLDSGKLNAKMAADTDKTIKILKSGTQPTIKKRQVMRAAFGDYRAKMADEEKKMRLKRQQIQFTSKTEANTSAFFVKKSALLASGKDFRFEFPVNELALNELDLNQEPPATNDAAPAALPKAHEAKAPTSQSLPADNSFRFNFSIDAE